MLTPLLHTLIYRKESHYLDLCQGAWVWLYIPCSIPGCTVSQCGEGRNTRAQLFFITFPPVLNVNRIFLSTAVHCPKYVNASNYESMLILCCLCYFFFLPCTMLKTTEWVNQERRAQFSFISPPSVAILGTIAKRECNFDWTSKLPIQIHFGLILA